MGMTIDEIIQGIQIIKAQAEWDYPLDWQIVLDGAIDTMRKYQKIEQIIEVWHQDIFAKDFECMAEIADVVEELEQEPITKSEALVSLDVYKQVAWERDIAIQQLHELGYEMGQKIESTTKNDLRVDCIDRAEVLKLMKDNWHTHNGDWAMQESMDDIRELPSVTPQEPQTFKWCTDCKEYDQEKHCCHRWSKVIRDTVEEMKQEPKTGHWIKSRDCYGNNHFTCSFCGHDIATKADIWNDNYCSNCGCRMIEPQESEE